MEAEAKAAPEAGEEKAPVDAIDDFFGEKKKEGEEEAPRDERPPTAVR